MTEDFKPGTRVQIAEDATYGWEGELRSASIAEDAGWGPGPWEGTVQDGPDGNGDYWVDLGAGSGLYAHRDFVTEAKPLPVGTRVRIAADATYGWAGESRTARLARDSGWGDGPWESTVQGGPDGNGDYWVDLGAGAGPYAHGDYLTAIPDEEAPKEDTPTTATDEPAPTHRLTALLRAITEAGYRATEVEATVVPPCGTITIRVEQA